MMGAPRLDPSSTVKRPNACAAEIPFGSNHHSDLDPAAIRSFPARARGETCSVAPRNNFSRHPGCTSLRRRKQPGAESKLAAKDGG